MMVERRCQMPVQGPDRVFGALQGPNQFVLELRERILTINQPRAWYELVRIFFQSAQRYLCTTTSTVILYLPSITQKRC